MSDHEQPTPEQRATHVAKIRQWLADGAGLFAREHVEPLLAEVDRLTAALSDRDEAAKLNAEEHLETLRQLADVTRKRDQARAELAAAGPRAGERFLRVRSSPADSGVGPFVHVEVDRTDRGDWYYLGQAPRSAIVSPPPEAEGPRVDAGAAKGCE